MVRLFLTVVPVPPRCAVNVTSIDQPTGLTQHNENSRLWVFIFLFTHLITIISNVYHLVNTNM